MTADHYHLLKQSRLHSRFLFDFLYPQVPLSAVKDNEKYYNRNNNGSDFATTFFEALSKSSDDMEKEQKTAIETFFT